MNVNLKDHVVKAAKWSSITELASKIVTPVTSMILARILAPEAFGVVATVSMIISFADMFTDAGFQKYLIQNEFEDEESKFKSTTVAFWTNFAVSILLCLILILFSDAIAKLVGNPGLGSVIAISSIQLPLTSFSSIQMALFKRDFNFKTLFFARMISVFIPIFITIPLAIFGFSYWSLIIGSIIGQLSNATILTMKSKWKPNLFYDFNVLSQMLAFSIWSLLEAISIWFSAWIDALIIGSALSIYYLGLYNTSLNMVNALMTVFMSVIIPILFSTLSRMQYNKTLFNNTFYKGQKIAAYLIFPLGLGLFIFNDVATELMLGRQWIDASFIIGIWGLTSAIKSVFSDLNSECYRAKGMPKLSFLLQSIHLAFLIPTCFIALKFGFSTLVYARALIRFELIISSVITMQLVLNIPFKYMLRNVSKPASFTLIMGIIAYLLRQVSNNLIWNIISIFLCILLYGGMVLFFAKEDYNLILKRRKNEVLN